MIDIQHEHQEMPSGDDMDCGELVEITHTPFIHIKRIRVNPSIGCSNEHGQVGGKVCCLL